MVWSIVQSLDFNCSLAESPETALATDWYSLGSLSCVGVSQHFCTLIQGALSCCTYHKYGS